ncbi:hypothetical protein [Sphingomonas hylomeconis]|uniref:Ribbon-helix-helix protein CopG domain-containing protein n=1 Tax=Sphingomonas hylomeconis TaxID=1395958 RepID=A0ABV7SVK2_9SPHN|nr:hypothetical protein [Sphingomonas hylomeconis]
MQTERVTFLTTPDQKAALDGFAVSNGMSVGHVVREATSRYIAQPIAARDEEEEALALLVPAVEEAVADMKATISAMRADIARTCATVDAVLAGERR